MLLYARFLSNWTSVPYVTHRVDMPGCHHTHIFLGMRLAHYIVRYSIGMPGLYHRNISLCTVML